MDARTPDSPTHCAECSREPLWRRPWRHHCENCKPLIRGLDEILADRPAERDRPPSHLVPDEGRDGLRRPITSSH